MDYEKIAVALQQRIGEQAARYEADLAILKVQAQEQIDALQAEVAELRAELDKDE